jgi:hypothetical protein
VASLPPFLLVLLLTLLLVDGLRRHPSRLVEAVRGACAIGELAGIILLGLLISLLHQIGSVRVVLAWAAGLIGAYQVVSGRIAGAVFLGLGVLLLPAPGRSGEGDEE